MAYTCIRGCGYSSRTAQGIRAHSRFCPNRQGQAVPTGINTGIRTGTSLGIVPRLKNFAVGSGEPAGGVGSSLAGQIQAERERLELLRIQEAKRELDAKADRRDEAKWQEFLRESDRRTRERAEREAAQLHAAEAAAKEERRRREEEQRQREAHQERVETGKRLAEKALETVPGLAPWAGLRIQQGVAKALEKAPDGEPLQNVVDNALGIQLRLHAPPKPVEPAPASVPIDPPAPAAADASDDKPDDEDEVCSDPNCPECAAADAGGSGWVGLALALGGIAVLAGAKYLADNRPAAAPPIPPSTA